MRQRAQAGVPPTSKPGGMKVGSLAYGLLILGLGVAMLPLLASEMPPLFDYPNHLARMHVLARWDEFASNAFFERDAFLIPNVMSDVIGIGLMALFDPFSAGRVLLALTLASMLAGAFALHAAATGRASPWPVLLVLPFLYNEMFFWGFLNYMLGLALMLWACAAWLYLERRGRAVQLAAGTVFAVLVFFAHLVAFGLLALAVAALELHRSWLHRAAGPAAAFRRLAASSAIFGPSLVLYAMRSPSRDLDLSIAFDFGIYHKLSPFTRLLSSGNTEADMLVLIGTTGIAAALLASRRARLEPRLAMLSVLFVMLSIALPYTALGSFFLDERVAIAAALVGFAAVGGTAPASRSTAPGADRRIPWGIAAAGIALFALATGRTIVIADDWRRLDGRYAAMLEAFEQIPEGGLIIPAEGAPFEYALGWFESRSRRPPVEHAASYATITRNAVVTNIFARRGQNPLVHDPSSDLSGRLAANPIRRVTDDHQLRNLIKDAEAVADGALPPLGRVATHLVLFWRGCGDGLGGSRHEALACNDDLTLLSIRPTPRPRDGDGSGGMGVEVSRSPQDGEEELDSGSGRGYGRSDGYEELNLLPRRRRGDSST
jgi:hypothetical protein